MANKKYQINTPTTFVRQTNITKLKMTLLCILAAILYIGCECNNVECSTKEDAFVEINFISNGEDIIFGSSPIIPIDELIINSDTETNIPYSTFENQIGIRLEHNKAYNIILGQIDTFQILGMLVLKNSEDCCDAFEFQSFEVNGEKICSSSCTQLDINID